MNQGFLDTFIRQLRVERNLSPASCASYRYQVLMYLRFLESKDRSVTTARRDDVTAFLEHKMTLGQGSSSRYAATIAIRQFHRYLAAKGAASSDPTLGLRLPRLEQRLPEPLSTGEMETLLKEPVSRKFHHIRDHAALELMYSSAIRVGELTGIRVEHVDLVNGLVRVFGKGGKERVVPVGPRAREALIHYLDAKQRRFPGVAGALFLNSRGEKLGRGGFWLRLRQLAARAGLAGRVFPHRIRHSTATHLLAGGADIRVVQELLGHRLITTSQRYTQVSGELLKRVCGEAHPRF